MKLLFAVVQDEDAKKLIRALVEHEISVTRISSTGGFLRGGNSTLMIGVQENQLDTALEVIKKNSSSRKSVTVPLAGAAKAGENAAAPMYITVGGAIVFQVGVEEFYKF